MTSTSNEFIYGECLSDHKEGKDRPGYAPDHFDVIHRSDGNFSALNGGRFVCDTLKKLGLPLPEPKDVHHGTDGKLLFLNNHGIVIRIGRNEHTDPRNFLHPHILQPLGWVSSQEQDVTVALYPALHLFELWDNFSPLVNGIKESFGRDSFCRDGRDISPYNIGYVILKSGEIFPLCLDISQRITELPLKEIAGRKTRNAFNDASQKQSIFDALKILLQDRAESKFSKEDQKEVFDFHQPLRHAFFSAWPRAHENGGSPNPERMKKFWQMAYHYAHQGYHVFGKDENGQIALKDVRVMPISWKKHYPKVEKSNLGGKKTLSLDSTL